MTFLPQRVFRTILEFCDDGVERRQKINHNLLLVEYTIVRDQSLHYIDLDQTLLYTGPNIVKSIRHECTRHFLEAAAHLLLLEMYQQKILSHDIDSINSTQPRTTFFDIIRRDAKSRFYPYFYKQNSKQLIYLINDEMPGDLDIDSDDY